MAKLLSQLKPPHGAVKKPKRLGRGDASGHGGTSTKGHKGQKARSGGYHKLGFEGGQMPLARRLPKRGFHNKFKKNFQVLNLEDLAEIPKDTKVDLDYLKSQRIIKQARDGVRILGNGEIKVPLTIVAHGFSKTAKEKIEKAGGKAELVAQKTRSKPAANPPAEENK